MLEIIQAVYSGGSNTKLTKTYFSYTFIRDNM